MDMFSGNSFLFSNLIKCPSYGVSEIISAQRHTANCVLRHNSRWRTWGSPQQFDKHLCGDFDSTLKLFSIVSYCLRHQFAILCLSQSASYGMCNVVWSGANQFDPSSLFTWHLLRGRSSKSLYNWKNILEEAILYRFWNYFPILENITLLFNLNLLATKYMFKLPMKWNFCHFLF